MENGGKMENPGEIYQLCRLCLANNQVNVPIFGEKSDIRQISLKISSCLPVVIAVDDLLPKNICEGCSDKLELFYAFWNSSQEADKTLRAWMEEININNASETISAVVKKIANSEEIPLIAEVKEETEDFAGDGQNKTIFNQQPFDDDEDVDEKESEEAPPSKRARLSPTVEENISINQESDDDDNEEYDVDEVEPKVEDESDMSDSEDDEPLSSIADRTGTSVDEPQAGPSGVGKDGAEAPIIVKEELDIVEEFLPELIKNEYPEEAVTPLRSEEDNESSFESFFRKNMFKKHVSDTKSCKRNTTSIEKKSKCEVCSKIFKTKYLLFLHQNVHTKELQFPCDICGKIFFTAYNFRNHKIVHRRYPVQNYQENCKVCGKKLNKQKLVEHMMEQHNVQNEAAAIPEVLTDEAHIMLQDD